MGVDGFECRKVSFDTVRHHRRGSAVRTAGARLAEEVTAINSNSVKYHKSEGKPRLAFFVCLLCGLAHKEQNKQKKHATQSSSVSSDKWELTDSNRRPSACKADALNQLS